MIRRVTFERSGAGDRATRSGFGLPADLLEDSRRRVKIIALLVLIAAGADTVLMLVDLVTGSAGATDSGSRPGFGR